jgi:ABC-type nickel/cobalt efflux system permease component RcnA
MNRRAREQPVGSSGSGLLLVLEYVTGCVLVLVVLALACLTLAAYVPKIDWGLTEAQQVVGILGLLTAGLALVSIVALLHTRRRT